MNSRLGRCTLGPTGTGRYNQILAACQREHQMSQQHIQYAISLMLACGELSVTGTGEYWRQR